MPILKNKLEIFIHILFWIFIFSAVNVDWSANWLDPSIRPKQPAPLSVLIFPVFIYINALVLIPKYFSIATWKKYALLASFLFIIPELFRIVLYLFLDESLTFQKSLFSRDSFIFGSPNVFFLALNLSFIYKLTRDHLIKKAKPAIIYKATKNPYENNNILNTAEADKLKQKLLLAMNEKQLYLNQDLSLRELAESIDSTEKKVSYLINQHIGSNFYEWVNQFRVEKFKTEIRKSENNGLSIVGVALNCGFPSKSSFYRAFKSSVGCSPSEYLKKLNKP